jgi:hypothetical protein
VPHPASKYNTIFTVALITQIILLLLPFEAYQFFFQLFAEGLYKLFLKDIPSQMLPAAIAILTPVISIPLLILCFWKSNFSFRHPRKCSLFFLLSVGVPLLFTGYFVFEKTSSIFESEFLLLASWVLIGSTQLVCYWLKIYTLVKAPLALEENEIAQHLIEED